MSIFQPAIHPPSSSCRVCNGSQPPHVSILHFRNVVYVRSLSEMCAARHDVVQVACGYAAHTVVAVPVAPHIPSMICTVTIPIKYT